MHEIDAQARRLAREGYGWQDIEKRLCVSEYHARCAVFGHDHARKWWERQQKKHAEKAS